MKTITKKQYQKAKTALKYIKIYNPTHKDKKKYENIITVWNTQNKDYIQYSKLNSKYNRLRYRIKKQGLHMDILRHYFKNVHNPFSRHTDITPIKFNGEQSIKELENINQELTTIFHENKITPYGKYNNVKLLFDIISDEDNFFNLLGSDQANEIRQDELLHRKTDANYISPKRWEYASTKINDIIQQNPLVFGKDALKMLKKIKKGKIKGWYNIINALGISVDEETIETTEEIFEILNKNKEQFGITNDGDNENEYDI